jgi:hypothetical protein
MLSPANYSQFTINSPYSHAGRQVQSNLISANQNRVSQFLNVLSIPMSLTFSQLKDLIILKDYQESLLQFTKSPFDYSKFEIQTLLCYAKPPKTSESNFFYRFLRSEFHFALGNNVEQLMELREALSFCDSIPWQESIKYKQYYVNLCIAAHEFKNAEIFITQIIETQIKHRHFDNLNDLYTLKSTCLLKMGNFGKVHKISLF